MAAFFRVLILLCSVITVTYAQNPLMLANAGQEDAALVRVHISPEDEYTSSKEEFVSPPVKLASFNASLVKKEVQLSWLLTTDKPIGYYKVQRSQDMQSWTDISPIILAPPSPNTLKDYTFKDPHPHASTNYYRLKQVDKSGRAEYSDVIAVERFEEGFHITNIYPNPALFGTTIELYLQEKAHVQIWLRDSQGNMVADIYEQDGLLGKRTIEIDLKDIPAGTYFCEIQAGKSLASRRIVR